MNNFDMQINDLLKEYTQLPDFVELGTISVNTKGNFGDYPIHIAATRGSLTELTLLLVGGADLNQKGEYGFTPLHEVANQGHEKAVIFLLEHGANKGAVDDYGETAYDIANNLSQDTMNKLLV